MAADFLTCGLCQTEFPLAHIVAFMQHKKYDCDAAATPGGLLQDVEKLQKYSCISCPEKFAAAVTLLQHVQFRHQIKVFMEEVYNCKTEALFGTSAKPVMASGTSRLADEPAISSLSTSLTLATASASTTAGASATGSTAPAAGAAIRRAESDFAIGVATSEVPLKKCCTSIVPKKRKRHIEMKHAYVGATSSAASAKSRRRSVTNMASNQNPENTDDDDSDTIYIDVNPSAGPRTERGDRQSDRQKNQPAVILQPGNTYSIPSSMSLPYVGITYGNRQMTNAGYGGNSAQPTNASVSCQAVITTENTVEAPCVEKMSTNKRSEVQRIKEDCGELTDGGNSADTSSNHSTAHRESTRSSGARRTQREDPTRPYKCDQCNHSFNQRIHLQKHLSKHTGVKPYKCQQCDYATVERSHLKVHIRIHTGEKPFKCTYCEYATAQNSTLKIHLKRHHGGFMLECTQCGKSFPERNQFNAHQREHGESEDTKDAAPANPSSAVDCAATAVVPTGTSSGAAGAAASPEQDVKPDNDRLQT